MIEDNEVISLEKISAIVGDSSLKNEIVAYKQNVVNPPLTNPVRLDCLLIMIVTEGSGSICIDLNEYELSKNSLIVIQPSNYVYFPSRNIYIKFNALACSRQIVEDVLPKLTDLLPLLMHHRTAPVKSLSDKDAEGINDFFNFMKTRLEGPTTPFLKQKVSCVLQALLFEMMDIMSSSGKLTGARKSRKEEIMAKFIILVSENFRQFRNLGFYSDKLCITPKHLSSVVKEISGHSAGDWIDYYVIMEAKVLLKTTDLTIQEISSKLNFANQSFFGKYFKHITGVTPSNFRKLNS